MSSRTEALAAQVKTVADRILGYLLEKYEEYERHSGGVGFSGYSVIYKVWNEAENREMSLVKMVALLTALGSGGGRGVVKLSSYRICDARDERRGGLHDGEREQGDTHIVKPFA